MSQRNSGFDRRRHDLYETPAWVVGEGLAPFLPPVSENIGDLTGLNICEPCCGRGKMVKVLAALGANVFPSDVREFCKVGFPHTGLNGHPFRKLDYLKAARPEFSGLDGFVINPPYGIGGRLAEAFIKRTLGILRFEGLRGRKVWAAFLLSADFDSASTRAELFEFCPEFRSRIVLRRRIEWFPREEGKSGPSQNHAWFIYSSAQRSSGELPTIRYAPAAASFASLVARTNALVANDCFQRSIIDGLRKNTTGKGK